MDDSLMDKREALGADLARTFMAVRQAEWEALKDIS